MQGPFKRGDIVGVDHKGRQFLMMIEEDLPKSREVRGDPITPNITYFVVPKREIKTKWTHSKGPVPVLKKGGGPVF